MIRFEDFDVQLSYMQCLLDAKGPQSINQEDNGGIPQSKKEFCR